MMEMHVGIQRQVCFQRGKPTNPRGLVLGTKGVGKQNARGRLSSFGRVVHELHYGWFYNQT
jgi:hypothetical protein